MSSDRILGSLSVVLAAFYVWAATQIELSFISDPVGPRIFPMIIAVMVGLSGLVILLRPDPEPQWPAMGKLLEIGAAVLVLAAYAQLLPTFGFLLCTCVAAAFLSWRLGSTPVSSLVAGVVIAIGIYIVFKSTLGLSLAKGPLDFLIDVPANAVSSAIWSVIALFGTSAGA